MVICVAENGQDLRLLHEHTHSFEISEGKCVYARFSLFIYIFFCYIFFTLNLINEALGSQTLMGKHLFIVYFEKLIFFKAHSPWQNGKNTILSELL